VSISGNLTKAKDGTQPCRLLAARRTRPDMARTALGEHQRPLTLDTRRGTAAQVRTGTAALGRKRRTHGRRRPRGQGVGAVATWEWQLARVGKARRDLSGFREAERSGAGATGRKDPGRGPAGRHRQAGPRCRLEAARRPRRLPPRNRKARAAFRRCGRRVSVSPARAAPAVQRAACGSGCRRSPSGNRGLGPPREVEVAGVGPSYPAPVGRRSARRHRRRRASVHIAGPMLC
jgi:hypothetical protein